jgi:hypothetical protein
MTTTCTQSPITRTFAMQRLVGVGIVRVWLEKSYEWKMSPLDVNMLASCAIPGYARVSYYRHGRSMNVRIRGWCLYASYWKKSILSIQLSADEGGMGGLSFLLDWLLAFFFLPQTFFVELGADNFFFPGVRIREAEAMDPSLHHPL